MTTRRLPLAPIEHLLPDLYDSMTGGDFRVQLRPLDLERRADGPSSSRRPQWRTSSRAGAPVSPPPGVLAAASVRQRRATPLFAAAFCARRDSGKRSGLRLQGNYLLLPYRR